MTLCSLLQIDEKNKIHISIMGGAIYTHVWATASRHWQSAENPSEIYENILFGPKQSGLGISGHRQHVAGNGNNR
jgi:hypothetical protein